MRLKHALIRNDGGAWGADAPASGLHETRVWRSTDIARGGNWQPSSKPATRYLTGSEIRGSALCPRDLLVTKASGSALHIGKTALVDAERVGDAFSNFMQRLRVRSDFDARYVWYLLNSTLAREHYKRVATTSTGLNNINGRVIAEMEVPLLSGHAAVVEYLDRECARLDELVELLQDQHRGLTERRSAVVLEAISGLRRSPLKHGYTVIDCKHRTPEYTAEGWPVISTREVRPGGLNLSQVDRFVPLHEYEDMRSGGRDPREGDVIYSRNATVGVAAYLDAPVDVCMGQDVVLITKRPANCELLSYVLNHAVAEQVNRLSLGSTFTRINVPVIRSLIVPNDAPEKEARAVAQIRGGLARLQAVDDEVSAMLALLEEYRSALVGEALTGRLAVFKMDEARMQESLHAFREGESSEALAS